MMYRLIISWRSSSVFSQDSMGTFLQVCSTGLKFGSNLMGYWLGIFPIVLNQLGNAVLSYKFFYFDSGNWCWCDGCFQGWLQPCGAVYGWRRACLLFAVLCCPWSSKCCVLLCSLALQWYLCLFQELHCFFFKLKDFKHSRCCKTMIWNNIWK